MPASLQTMIDLLREIRVVFANILVYSDVQGAGVVTVLNDLIKRINDAVK